jgi:hypothetical protein
MNVIAALPEINIRSGFNERLDNWQFLAFRQHAAEHGVGDIMQRMVGELLTIVTPSDERIGLCRIGRENPAKLLGVAGSDCSSYVHGGIHLLTCHVTLC